MSSARRRAVRAVLSALAGGGLTAASLGAGLPSTALAAEPSPGTATTGEGTTTTGEASTSPTTTTPATTTTTTPTSAAPAPAATPTVVTSAPQPTEPPAAAAPTVVLQRRQKATGGAKPTAPSSSTVSATKEAKTAKGANNVALSPQLIAAQASALASTEASIQALGFYRIPLFLLPIYKAAAVQYGVPWQILAAINEVETDYGSDLSVSSAGAVGWMQFMPATWLQYGVDALNAGYADPYNPVDAIFAAARYLRAAGASTNLHDAILSYNHSEEYVSSVLLRAKLIASYPKDVIATLTGLVDGRLPVAGGEVSWSALPARTGAPGAQEAPETASAAGSSAAATGHADATTPGSTPAPTPAAAVAAAGKAGRSHPLELVELTGAAHAKVLAVQDGRVMKIGHSPRLGRYLVLRDVYGDLFTYAGLGSLAPNYTLPKTPSRSSRSAVVQAAINRDPVPSEAATAGFQTPLTLQVKTPTHTAPVLGGEATVPDAGGETAPPGMNRVRLFAHPGNPDARAAVAADARARARREKAEERLPLKPGAVVASGTVLGTVSTALGAHAGHIRFAIRPAGDSTTVAPGPILANWAELQASLHPQGANGQDPLLGATASDVFLLSKSQLQRAVLSDPGISIYSCGRHDVASGAIDKRVLAVLAFLSRSGLKPTVTALRCGQSPVTADGGLSAAYRGDEVEISAINGVPMAGHQGAGTITDLAIRTLLTLPARFVPSAIFSLMQYPGSSNTHASSGYWNRFALVFDPPVAADAPSPAGAAAAAHSARSGRTAPTPALNTSLLTVAEWNQLISHISAIATPSVRYKPSSSAIPDPKR